MRDEFAKVPRRKIRAHHQHHRGRDQADDRSEVLRRIVLEVLDRATWGACVVLVVMRIV